VAASRFSASYCPLRYRRGVLKIPFLRLNKLLSRGKARRYADNGRPALFIFDEPESRCCIRERGPMVVADNDKSKKTRARDGEEKRPLFLTACGFVEVSTCTLRVLFFSIYTVSDQTLRVLALFHCS